MFGKRSTASDLLLDRPPKPAEIAVEKAAPAAPARAAVAASPGPSSPRPRKTDDGAAV